MKSLEELIAAVVAARQAYGSAEEPDEEAWCAASEALDAELTRRHSAIPTDSLTQLIAEYGRLCANAPVEAEHGSNYDATLTEARAELQLDQIKAEVETLRTQLAKSQHACRLAGDKPVLDAAEAFRAATLSGERYDLAEHIGAICNAVDAREETPAEVTVQREYQVELNYADGGQRLVNIVGELAVANAVAASPVDWDPPGPPGIVRYRDVTTVITPWKPLTTGGDHG